MFLPQITGFPDLAWRPLFKISKICGLSLLRVSPSGDFQPKMEEEEEGRRDEGKGERVENEKMLWRGSSVASECAEDGNSMAE